MRDPADGLSVAQGELVVLQGSATDAEDGPLDGPALTWWSDRDGFLGEGTEPPVDTLSPGRHLITLRAEDGDGMAAEASVEIWVRAPIYLPVVMRGAG